MAKYQIKHSSTNKSFGFASTGELSSNSQTLGAKNGATVAVLQEAYGPFRFLKFTLTATPVTLVKNGTSSGGGGVKIFDFSAGLILPVGGSSNLTVANALDKSFLASLGTTVQGTGGSLATTTSNFLPSTAATTSTGAGTCKMKSTVSIPVPGTPIDGTATDVDLYLNACLNADATGAEALTFSGSIWLVCIHLGDN